MSFIGEEFEEQLTHEGILDLFKDKNIKISKRMLKLLEDGDIRGHDWLSVSGEFRKLTTLGKFNYDVNTTKAKLKKVIADNRSKLKDFNKTLKDFLSSDKNKVVIAKDNKAFASAKWYARRIHEKHIISDILDGYIFIFIYGLRHEHPYGLIENNEFEDSDITESVKLTQKFIEEIVKNKEVEITTEKVTTESALTIEEVTTETAVNLSGVLELIKARDELDTLSQSLTTESGFTFVTKVKDFFANTIREIRNKLSNIFSQQDITLKYQEDKIKELKLLTNICSRLGSIKFSQIEYIELPIMMGMKPNYNQTVFELNNLITSFKGAIEQIEDLNNLLSNLIVDKDDIRISNNPRLYKFAREILDTRNKTTRIINEITETKQPTDVKQAGKLFNNLGSIKDINVSYINLYQETIKFDIGKYVTGINRLSTLLTAWIDSVNDRDGEVKYSTNVISVVQDNVSNIANITTNLGIYIAYLNQTSAFFATDVNMLSEKI